MMRTRDVFILLILCFLGALTFLVFFISCQNEGGEAESVHTTPPIIFLTPHEAYDVAPYVDESVVRTRESFIEKVRSTYREETPPVQPEVVIETAPEVISVPTTTLYGNTRF